MFIFEDNQEKNQIINLANISSITKHEDRIVFKFDKDNTKIWEFNNSDEVNKAWENIQSMIINNRSGEINGGKFNATFV